MMAAVDARLRQVVADVFGVDGARLAPSLSLAGDLAADSLDLAELAVAIEGDLGIPLDDELRASIRTYGDLVRAVARRARAGSTPGWMEPVFARVRVLHADGTRPTIERVGRLTSYAIESIVDDCWHAGSGTRLEVVVGRDVEGATVQRIYDRLERISRRGVQVLVLRDGRLAPGSYRRAPSPAAA